MNTLLIEYCGPLIGGPNDGEIAEATVTRIPVANASFLWLDGIGESKKVVSKRILGTYIWNAELRHFKWSPEGFGFNPRGT